MPMEWGHSLTVPFYKGKGDALQCVKYRGLRLLKHGMKIFERVLYKSLKHGTKIDENRFGFITGSLPLGPFSSSNSSNRNI